MEAAREITLYQQFSEKDIEATRNIIAPGAPDHIIRLVLYRCAQLGCDPLSKMIYAVNRPRKKDRASLPDCPKCGKKLRKGQDNWYCWKKQDVADGCGKTVALNDPLVANLDGDKEDNWVLQSSIDFFRSMAETTGEYVGQLGPFWCGSDGQWQDVWLSNDAPVAAKVGILRSSFREPLWAVARFSAYAQMDNAGKLTGLWPKMGDLMSAKCAEALGFRKAFPAKFHGIYIAEEMQQADNVAAPEAKPAQAAPQALAPAPAAPSASIFAKPDSEMKVAQELTDEARVRELGKKLGKLAGAVNMDLAKTNGDLASLRRSYEEQLAKEPVRGHSPSTHGSPPETPGPKTVENRLDSSPPEEGANPAPETIKNITPQDDTAQTKLVMDIMAEFCKPGMIELYPTIAEQFSAIRASLGRNVEKYSELSVDECQVALADLKAQAESLANDEKPDAELLQKAQMACKDVAFMEKLKKSKAYTEAAKTRTQAEAVRAARLAFAKATLGREFASFSEMTNAELEKIITAAKNFAKGTK